jgi:hypothetical protein
MPTAHARLIARDSGVPAAAGLAASSATSPWRTCARPGPRRGAEGRR